MRILVGCESSGIVREAFRAKGHDAVSCDVTNSEQKGPHIKGNVLDHLEDGWDMLIAFPPCTYLTRAQNGFGREWIYCDEFIEARDLALLFVAALLNAPIPKIALENPPGAIATHIMPSTQRIHPWQFGHPIEKTTCLWLKGLPPLVPTCIASYPRVPWLKVAHTPRDRSRTFPGIARAMAQQWSPD